MKRDPSPGTKKPKSPEATYSRALRLLGRREHSRQELQRKLAVRGVEPTDIDQTLRRLDERGFQSDDRFAGMLVRSRIAQGHGPVRILAELRQHGLSDEQARRAIDSEAPDWTALAARVCRRRFAGPPTDYAERVKRANFLARRGFPADIARHVAGDPSGDSEF